MPGRRSNHKESQTETLLNIKQTKESLREAITNLKITASNLHTELKETP